MTTRNLRLLALFTLAACGTEAVGTLPSGATDGVIEPAFVDRCVATLEPTQGDLAPEGFDATPDEARAALEGLFTGISPDGDPLTLSITVDGAIQVARVQRIPFEDDAPDGAEAVLGACVDHLLIPARFDLSGPVGLDGAVDITYFDGEDAGDGFGWDTAAFALRTSTWEGEAAPTWSPDEMEVIEMVLMARWDGGHHESDDSRTGIDVEDSIWSVDLSFWGENLPSGPGDDATVWAAEELLFDAELRPSAD